MIYKNILKIILTLIISVSFFIGCENSSGKKEISENQTGQDSAETSPNQESKPPVINYYNMWQHGNSPSTGNETKFIFKNQDIGLTIRCTDENLDLDSISIALFYPADTTEAFYIEELELPEQPAETVEFDLFDNFAENYPVGDWKLEIQLHDKEGNSSEIKTISYNLIKRIDVSLKDMVFNHSSENFFLATMESVDNTEYKNSLMSIDTLTGDTVGSTNLESTPNGLFLDPKTNSLYISQEEDVNGSTIINYSTIDLSKKSSFQTDGHTPYSLVKTSDSFIFFLADDLKLFGYNLEEEPKVLREYTDNSILLSSSNLQLFSKGFDVNLINIEPYYEYDSWGYYNAHSTIFLDPSGRFILTESGNIQFQRKNNEQPPSSLPLTDSTVLTAILDSENGYLYTFEKGDGSSQREPGIHVYDYTTFERIDSIPFPIYEVHHMALIDDAKYIAVLSGDDSFSWYTIIPSTSYLRSPKNISPVADFSVSSNLGTTIESFTFNAEDSTDEMEDSNLRYMWDLNGDGRYDTEFSNDAQIIHSFNTPGEYPVTLCVIDPWGLTDIVKKIITVTGEPLEQYSMGKYVSLSHGNDSEFVYALDQTSNMLITVNVFSKKIVKQTQLPEINPELLTYIASDNTFWISNSGLSNISIFDCTTNTFSSISFPVGSEIINIVEAESFNRLYVTLKIGDDYTVRILNLSTKEYINEFIGIPSFIDYHRQLVYLDDYIYSIDSDNLVEVSERHFNISNGIYDISPDGNHLMVSKTPNRFLFDPYDVDANNPGDFLGRWVTNSGAMRTRPSYSPDGLYIYVADADTFRIMSTRTYETLRTYSFPHYSFNNTAVFTPNIDGSIVVGQSTDPTFGTPLKLLFFDDVQPDENTSTSSQSFAIENVNDPDHEYHLYVQKSELIQLSKSSGESNVVQNLPFSKPIDMVYSNLDNTIFILNQYANSIYTFNLSTATPLWIPFLSKSDILAIDVNPESRKIHLVAMDGDKLIFAIIDMDSHGVIFNKELSAIDNTNSLDNLLFTISIDEDNSILYIYIDFNSIITTKKYHFSIAEDSIEEIEI